MKKKIIDMRKRVLVVTILSFLKSIHNLMLPSFFLTNRTRAPHSDTLELMKPLSTNPFNWVFNSCNFFGNILYRAYGTRIITSIKLMVNLTLRSGDNLERSFGRKSWNSQTIGISFKFISFTWNNISCAYLSKHLLKSNCRY